MSELLRHITLSVDQLESSAKIIQDAYQNNTDLIAGGVDTVVSIFGGESVKKIHEKSLQRIRTEAEFHQSQLLAEISQNMGGDISTKQKIQDLQDRLSRLSQGTLRDISLMQMIKNTNPIHIGENALSGLKGETKGVYSGLKGTLNGAYDITKFIFHYGKSMFGVHPEYKKMVDDQARILNNWIRDAGMKGMYHLIKKLIKDEIKRISALPATEQAEAIGNLAGHIIAGLTVIKGGKTLIEKTPPIVASGVATTIPLANATFAIEGGANHIKNRLIIALEEALASGKYNPYRGIIESSIQTLREVTLSGQQLSKLIELEQQNISPPLRAAIIERIMSEL